MTTTNIPCVHHWIIEPANGATSPGACVLCFEIREFSNSVDHLDGWNGESGKSFKNKEIQRARQETIDIQQTVTN